MFRFRFSILFVIFFTNLMVKLPALQSNHRPNLEHEKSSPELQRILKSKFFIEVDEHCQEELTLPEYLYKKKDMITSEELSMIDSELPSQLKDTRRRRLSANSSSFHNLRHNSGFGRHRRQLLLEKTPEERRDEMIAALSIIASARSSKQKKRPGLLSFGKKNRLLSSFTTYLEQFNMDIIDNDVLPDDTLMEIAKEMPCLKYKPEFDSARYSTSVESDVVIPNDPYAQPSHSFNQWYYWAHSDAVSSSKNYGGNFFRAWKRYRGERNAMTVAVVDSGCGLHSDLKENICIDERCKGYDFGDDTENFSAEPIDSVHGTPISGAIAGVANNGKMTAGVCWKCKIMCLKVHSSRAQAMLTSATIAALNFIKRKKVLLSNHSYAGSTPSFAEMSAINQLKQAGHIMVAAAGNFGCNLDIVPTVYLNRCENEGAKRRSMYPVAYDIDNIVGVGSTTATGELASFSNYGLGTVDLLAPGEGIIALYDERVAPNGVAVVSGTSISTALVTGLIALIWSSRPELSYSEVIKIILSTSLQLPHLYGAARSGGIIDAAAALDVADGIRDRLFVASDDPYSDECSPDADNDCMPESKCTDLFLSNRHFTVFLAFMLSIFLF